MNDWILRELELMLLTAILILGAVCIAKAFGRKIGYRWRKLLWLLIAIRLVIPAYSIEQYFEQNRVAQKVEETQGIEISLPIAQPTWNSTSQIIVLDDVVVDVDESREEVAIAEQSLWKHAESIWVRYDQYMIGIIWGIGAVLFIGIGVVQYQCCKRRYLKHAFVCEDERIITLWQQVCNKKAPTIQICEQISSPMLMGYGKTSLLLPHIDYSEQEMTMMFRHEAMHYQKKDLWYKLFLSIVCDLYWFNPMFRYMKKLAFQDVEYVCDELVTRDMNKEERYSYGQIILKTMTHTWQDAVVYTTQFAAGKKTAKNRLGLLFTGKHRKIGFVIAAVLVLGIVGVGMRVSLVWQDRQMEELLTEDVHAQEIETEDMRMKDNQIEKVLQDVDEKAGASNTENIEKNWYGFPETYQAELGNVTFDTKIVVSEAVNQNGLYDTKVKLKEKDYETPCKVIFKDIEIGDKDDNIPADDKRYGRSVWCTGVDDTTFSMNNRHLNMRKENYLYYRRLINLGEDGAYNGDVFLTGEEFDFMTIKEAYQYVLQYMSDIGMDIDASDSFAYTCYSMNYKTVEALENVEKEAAQGNIAYLRQFKQSKWTEADHAYFFTIHQTWQDCMVQYPSEATGTRVADYNAPINVLVTQNGVVGLDSHELFDFEQGENVLQLLAFEDIATSIATEYNRFLPNSQYIVKSAMLYLRPEEQEDYSFELIPTWEVTIEETSSERTHCIYINALNGEEL